MEFRWGTLKQVTHGSKLKYFPLCINVDLHTLMLIVKTLKMNKKKNVFFSKNFVHFLVFFWWSNYHIMRSTFFFPNLKVERKCGYKFFHLFIKLEGWRFLINVPWYVYLHILKKNGVKKSSIFFRNWLVKCNL
jgi:hypothetical protein